jgi:hypothetical protein
MHLSKKEPLLFWLPYLIVFKRKEYVITFGARRDQFSYDMPAVQQMVDSFQIINNTTTNPIDCLLVYPTIIKSLTNKLMNSKGIKIKMYSNRPLQACFSPSLYYLRVYYLWKTFL